MRDQDHRLPLTSLLKNTAFHFSGFPESPTHAKLRKVSGYLHNLSAQLQDQKLRLNMVCQVVLLNVSVFHTSFK